MEGHGKGKRYNVLSATDKNEGQSSNASRGKGDIASESLGKDSAQGQGSIQSEPKSKGNTESITSKATSMKVYGPTRYQ